MPARAGQAQQPHPQPIRPGHRFPIPHAHGGHGQHAHGSSPEKAGGRTVPSRHIARQQAVNGKHQRRYQRDHRAGLEHTETGFQNDQDTNKAHADRHPAPPAHLFPQNRAGQGCNQQRVTGKNRVAFHQPQHGKAPDRHADFRDQQYRAKRLYPRLAGRRSVAQSPRLACANRNNKGRKEPIADHHNHQHVIFPGQMA